MKAGKDAFCSVGASTLCTCSLSVVGMFEGIYVMAGAAT